MTKLEQEKRKKKLLAETVEVLDETGQENEKKAAEAVKEVMKGVEEKKSQHQNFVLNRLDMLRGNSLKYRDYLRRVSQANLEGRIDWPSGCFVYCKDTLQGLEFHVHFQDKTHYTKGLKLLYDPEWDVYGVDMIITQVENTLDKHEGRGVYREREAQKSNIIVPKGKFSS